MDTPTPTPQPQPTPAPEGQKSGKNILVILLVVIVGLILLGWLAAFVIGKVVSKVVSTGMRAAIEKGTGVKIEGSGDSGSITFTGKDGKKVVIDGSDDSGSITFTGDNGETATFEGGSTSLPDDFPSSFPVYAGMKVEGTGRSSAQEGTLFMANWTSTASTSDVSAWYKAELPKNGWNISATTEASGTTSYIFEKTGTAEKKDTGWMSIVSDDGATTVSVWITQVR